MGYIKHHTIIVTSCNREAIAEAATKAVALGLQILGPSDPALNGYSTILICPDGSKEGWPESDAGDLARTDFKEWLLSTRHDDGSGPLDWFEASYGSDDQTAEISQHAWKNV